MFNKQLKKKSFKLLITIVACTSISFFTVNPIAAQKINQTSISTESQDLANFISGPPSLSDSFTHAEDCGCEKQNTHSESPFASIPPPAIISIGFVFFAWAITTPGLETVFKAFALYLFSHLTIACLMIFYKGWYLRFRSGLAPGAYTALTVA